MTTTEYPMKIRLENKQLVPVKLDCISLEDVTCLTLRTQNGLYFEIFGWSRDIYPLLLRWAKISNPDANYSQRIQELTPQQVVAYFEASPVLSYMADEVKAAILPAGSEKVNYLDQDIAKVSHLVQPSLADISEVLTGSRYYRGATYARVKAVQNALNSSSSPHNGDVEQLKEAA